VTHSGASQEPSETLWLSFRADSSSAQCAPGRPSSRTRRQFCLCAAHFYFDLVSKMVGETVGEVAEPVRWAAGRSGTFLGSVAIAERDDLLDARTERPSATIRWARRSWASGLSRPSRTRAWPALMTLRRTTPSARPGRLRSRRVLLICGVTAYLLGPLLMVAPKSIQHCW